MDGEGEGRANPLGKAQRMTFARGKTREDWPKAFSVVVALSLCALSLSSMAIAWSSLTRADVCTASAQGSSGSGSAVSTAALTCSPRDLTCTTPTHNLKGMVFISKPPVLVELSNATVSGNSSSSSSSGGLRRRRMLGIIGDVFSPMADIAEKVWSIIKDGRPTIEMDSKSANAIPSGHDLMEVEFDEGYEYSQTHHVIFPGWTSPPWAQVTLELRYQCAGTIGGKGAFIGNARPLALDEDAFWGQDLSVNVEFDSPTHRGKLSNPIAQLGGVIRITDAGRIWTSEHTCTFMINGDCATPQFWCESTDDNN